MSRAASCITVAFIAILSMTLAGCETGTPGMTNTLGSFSSVINGPPDRVTDAALDAVKELGLTSPTSTESKIDGTVMAKTAQNADVKITIEQAGDNTSKVSVKVGGMGDEAISTEIFNRIKADLNKPAAPTEGEGLTKTEGK